MSFLKRVLFCAMIWLSALFPPQAKANKLSELKEIKKAFLAQMHEKYEADTSLKQHTNGMKHWSRRAISSEYLARITTWLSTLSTDPSRYLEPEEKFCITDLIKDISFFTADESDLDWSFKLERLILNISPDIVIRPIDLMIEIHKLLQTGETLTKSLTDFHELSIRRSLLDFLSEEDTLSKAQISRAWRNIIHDYQKYKGYPSAIFPEEQDHLREKLNQRSSLTISEKAEALREAEFSGYAAHRQLVLSIFWSIEENRMRTVSSYNALISDLQRLKASAISGTLLHRLISEIIQLYLDGSLFSELSLEGKEVLAQYHTLARSGNMYAQQTLHWLEELKLPKKSLLPDLTDCPFSDRSLPESFPDIRLFGRWKETVELCLHLDPKNIYTYRAALSRLYRKPYFQFASKLLMDMKGTSSFLDHAARARFYSRIKLREKQKAYGLSLVQYLDQETSAYAAAGDPQRAISIIEKEVARYQVLLSEDLAKNLYNGISPDDLETMQNRIFLYDHLLASDSDLSLEQLTHGKSEDAQKRILLNFDLAKTKSNLSRSYFNLGLYLYAYKSLPPQSEDKADSFLKWDLLMAFYKAGVVRSLMQKTSDEDDLSAYDLLITTERTGVPSSNSGKGKQEVFSPEELATQELISDLKNVSPELWASKQSCQGTVGSLFSALKQFDRARFFYEKEVWDFTEMDRRRLAQAEIETGAPEKALQTLEKSRQSTYVDHELRIQALRKLGRFDELQQVYRERDTFERTSLLPDMRRAAKIYQEDKDFKRARKILSKVSHISERLGDENHLKDVESLRLLTEDEEKEASLE